GPGRPAVPPVGGRGQPGPGRRAEAADRRAGGRERAPARAQPHPRGRGDRAEEGHGDRGGACAPRTGHGQRGRDPLPAGRMSEHEHTACWVVIPAAGIGSRMRADCPKQYLQLAGRTILEHTLNCFLDHPRLKGLVLSLAADDPWWPTLRCADDPRIRRAEGGAERADSVLAGLLRLLELGARQDDWVLVHDAARPNLARSDLDQLLAELA